MEAAKNLILQCLVVIARFSGWRGWRGLLRWGWIVIVGWFWYREELPVKEAGEQNENNPN